MKYVLFLQPGRINIKIILKKSVIEIDHNPFYCK